MVARQGRCDLGDMGQGMAGLERGDDSLGLAGQLKGLQCLGIGDRNILRPPDIMQPRMFRPDAGVIETRRNLMPLEDLTIGILQQIGAVAMQHAGAPAGQAGAMLHPVIDTTATGLYADYANMGIVEKGVEQPHRV